MSKGDKSSKKEAYFARLESYLEEYQTIFIVNVDNVGSNQMHQIRQHLRGEGVVLMGKNTMVRKVLRNLSAANPNLEKLLQVVKGNVGFVFTKGDLKKVRKVITENRVRAPAKAGAIAPVDVSIPPGNTGMPPDKTSFFQALGVPTKISRGTIEIVSEVHLIKAGSKVGPSEATLLNMLNISPFTYGLSITNVYDSGAIFKPEILDIEESDLLDKLKLGIRNIAAISLAIGYPTTAMVPHSIINGYKKCLGIALGTEYSFPAADKIKEILSDPSKLAALAAAAAPASNSAAAPTEAKKEEAKEEEESDEDMGFGLFD